MGPIGQACPIVGEAEECPGLALLPDYVAFLRARFERLDGESAAPGHRGSYAVVRQGNVEIGLVAVDGDLGIWFTVLSRQGDDGPGADARHLQRELVRYGFAHSKRSVLAVLYFHLLHAPSAGAGLAAARGAAAAAVCRQGRRPMHLGRSSVAVASWRGDPKEGESRGPPRLAVRIGAGGAQQSRGRGLASKGADARIEKRGRMHVSHYGLFLVASLALLLTPGPAVLYIIARAVDQGRRAGLISTLGLHVGTLVHLAAAVAGLSALLVSSAMAFSMLRWAGAA
jgi:hypothetical protein